MIIQVTRVRTGIHVENVVGILSTSTRSMVRRLSVEKPASLQQASGRLHDEAWASRVGCAKLKMSQEVEIASGCVGDCVQPSNP